MVKASHSHGTRCGNTGRAPAKSKDFGKQHWSLPRPLHLQNNTPTTMRLSEVGSIDTPIGGKQVNNQPGFGKPQWQTHTRHFRSRLDGCQQLTSRPGSGLAFSSDLNQISKVFQYFPCHSVIFPHPQTSLEMPRKRTPGPLAGHRGITAFKSFLPEMNALCLE